MVGQKVPLMQIVRGQRFKMPNHVDSYQATSDAMVHSANGDMPASVRIHVAERPDPLIVTNLQVKVRLL